MRLKLTVASLLSAVSLLETPYIAWSKSETPSKDTAQTSPRNWCKAWNFSLHIPAFPVYETAFLLSSPTTSCILDRMNVGLGSISVHISICPYLLSNLLAKPYCCFRAGPSLDTFSHQIHVVRIKIQLWFISPYWLRKLFGNVTSSSSIECAGVRTLPD